MASIKGLTKVNPETGAMFGEKAHKAHPFGSQMRRPDVDALSTLDREGTVEEFYFLQRTPACDVALVTGGVLNFVPFPGGIIDELSKFFHGDWIQPVIGQKVIVSFAEGDPQNPYISSLIWRPGSSLTAIDYKTVFQTKWQADDIIRGHKSGSLQRFSALPTPQIFTGYDILVDPSGAMGITQGATAGPLLTPGMSLGNGGGLNLHQPVAVANHNYVMTSLGLQPIIDSRIVGPRIGVGTGVQA